MKRKSKKHAPTADTGEPEPHVGFRRPREVAKGNFAPKRYKGLEGAALWRAIHRDREQRALDKLKLGAGRLGGVPDLPPEMAWPTGTRGGKKWPLPLLAQIDLAAVRGRCPALPDAGWLYVFGALDDYPDTVQLVVTLHQGARSDLVRAPLPDDPRAAGLEETVPLTPRPPENDDPSDGGAGWLFGEPWPFYGTPGEIAASEGRDGDGWINLLAIASVGSMQWSDAGHLYLLIRRRDLAKLDFSNVVASIGSS